MTQDTSGEWTCASVSVESRARAHARRALGSTNLELTEFPYTFCYPLILTVKGMIMRHRSE